MVRRHVDDPGTTRMPTATCGLDADDSAGETHPDAVEIDLGEHVRPVLLRHGLATMKL